MVPLIVIAGGFLVGLFRASNEYKPTLPAPVEKTDDANGKVKKSLPVAHNHDRDAEERKSLDRDLAVASATLGMAVAGALFYPPLSLLSGLGVAYVSVPFIRKAIQALRRGKVDVNVVDSIAVPASFITGFYVVSAFASWWYCLAQNLALKTKDQSKKQLISAFSDLPRSVWVWVDGVEVEQRIELLHSGDIVAVNAGDTIGVDGVIVDGVAAVDQHVLTGESQPSEKAVGDRVFASTIVLSGKLRIQVEQSGAHTVAAQIGELLNNTAETKLGLQTRGEALADKAALPTLALSLLALPLMGPAGSIAILWSFIGVDIRIVAPISTLNFLRIASQNGVLVKDGRALEQLSQVDAVVFDKTGTLTQEQPLVAAIHVLDGYDEDQLLSFAATAEYKQTHPIAQAILHAAKQRNLDTVDIDAASYEIGYGIAVRIGCRRICVGSQRFMAMENVAMPTGVDGIVRNARERGNSLVMVGVDGRLAGAIELQASLRPEVKQLVHDLRQRDLDLYIISGDSEKPTQRLAGEIGIDHYFYEVLPENKAKIIEQLQQAGKKVCFIGDGINDSIALRQADVSISLASGSTVAKDSAQILLLGGNLECMGGLFALAREMEINQKRGMWLTVIPGTLVIGSVFLLHTSALTSILVNNFALMAGVGNSMLPLANHRNSKKAKEEHLLTLK